MLAQSAPTAGRAKRPRNEAMPGRGRARTGPGGEKGRRGRLKIAWLHAVQVRILPRAPSDEGVARSDVRANGARGCGRTRAAGHRRQEKRLPLDGRGANRLLDVGGLEQLLERVPIEQRGALVAVLGQLQLQPEDLARGLEDLS